MASDRLPAMYRAVVVKEIHGQLETIERPMPTPGPGEVLIKVAACGVCHSDLLTVHSSMKPIAYPRVPGHEVVGHVVSVASDVAWPSAGMLVGVGWHGNHCLFCEACRRGDFMACPKYQVTGLDFDGGYQEYMLVHWTGVAELPPDMDPIDAAPLLCAGITMFNGMRHQKHLMPGDLVAVQGLGGLGHLGVQFAAKMGFRVVAISTSSSKAELAKQLGAHEYIDTSTAPASQQLQDLGGAKLIVATAPSADSMGDLLNGLGQEGRLLIVGADGATFPVSPFNFIPHKTAICGWASGTASDSTDCCRFAALHRVRSMNEVYTLDQAQQALDRMEKGSPRFRVVIKMD